jgi:hypothetical protein
MSLVEDVDLDDPDDILPPRKQRPDPPADKRQQDTEAVAPPPVVNENRERPAKRSPLARGTVALGGTAVAGTLLAVVAGATGPLGLIMTATGAVLVPLGYFSAKARGKGGSRRRGSGRQRGGGGRRRGNASWWPGGIGGGGKHGGTTGRGTRGAVDPGRRTSGGARSGGMPGTGGSRRAGTGLGGGSRRRAGTGAPKLGGAGGGRKRAGTGANWGGTRGRGGMPGGRTRGGRLRGGSGFGRHGGGRHGVGGGRLRVPRVGGGRAPRFSGFGLPGRTARGLGRGMRGLGRGIGKGMGAANRGGFNMGTAAVKGARKPTGRRAFVKAYQQYGKKKTPKTVTGFAGRILGSTFAGLSAGTARFLSNRARKAWRSLLAAYATKPPAVAQPTVPQGPTGHARPAPKKHPVPQPAFTSTAQPTTSPAKPGPGAPTPVPAGAGGGSNPGGTTPMTSSVFPPYNTAVDLYAACCKFQPVGPNGKPSIWPLHDALPALVETVYMFTNGYSKIVANCEQTLAGGLHPAMRSAMAEVWSAMVVASRAVEQLQPTFTRVYAEAIARANTRGRESENV